MTSRRGSAGGSTCLAVERGIPLFSNYFIALPLLLIPRHSLNRLVFSSAHDGGEKGKETKSSVNFITNLLSASENT